MTKQAFPHGIPIIEKASINEQCQEEVVKKDKDGKETKETQKKERINNCIIQMAKCNYGLDKTLLDVFSLISN